jgi:hypothetical protein
LQLLLATRHSHVDRPHADLDQDSDADCDIGPSQENHAFALHLLRQVAIVLIAKRLGAISQGTSAAASISMAGSETIMQL